MDLGLKGRSAIVTGAGRGMGRAFAEALAAEGARVAVWDVGSCAETTDAIAAKGGECLARKVDVTDETSVQDGVAEVVQRWGGIDILVNNAGIVTSQRLGEIPLADWNRVLAVNLTGVMLCAQAVVPHMKAKRWGRIINAASFAAVVPSAGGSAYAATKAGVVSLTRVWAGELGPWDITVNAYVPGTIATEMTRRGREHNPDALLDLLSLRRFGRPEDVANAICFLASEPAGYITGSTIEVTGGKLSIQRPGDEHKRP